MGFHFCWGHCGARDYRNSINPGAGLRFDRSFSLVLQKSHARRFRDGRWLVVTQWLSSAFGGYLTGRLRTKWVGVRTDEVLFRDTAHGLLAWALATLIMATLVTLASIATAGVAAAAPDTAATAASATAEAAEQARKLGIAFAFTTSLSLLVGAFVAAAAGGLGGYHRDEA